MENKLLRTLAIVGALWSAIPKTAAAEGKENVGTKANVSVFANAEQVGNESTFGELTFKPYLEVGKNNYKVNYHGCFYKNGYTDRTQGDWMTLMSRLQLENNDWAFQVGRMQLRPDFAGYLKTPFTTTLNNDVMAAGTSRTLTGAHLGHKGTGLGIGLVANDTRMTPTHWDTGLITYDRQLCSEWGLAAHIGAGDKGFHNAGLTVAWTPNNQTAVVAEGIYAKKSTLGVVGIRHKLTDDLAVFAGIKGSKPNHGKVDGWATAGASYNLGKGFSIVGALKQGIGGDHKFQGIIGLKYGGTFGINAQ